jgi:ABC-type branched-subunit amino acid transport system ATPase component
MYRCLWFVCVYTKNKSGKAEMENILSIKNVTKRFGSFTAVDGVSLDVEENEIVGIIGPNGAGKTTFLSILTGRYIPEEGSVMFWDADITKQKPEQRVHTGLMLSFQLVHVFDNLTVYENIALSYYRKRENKQFPLNFFTTNLYKDEEISKRVDEALEAFDLADTQEVLVSSLSLGAKKKLEIAMSWIADPAVLLLDEPFAGIGDQEIDEILMVLNKLKGHKTIVIVEHKISKLDRLVDKLAVMHEGRLIACGGFQETMEDDEVRRCYWKIVEGDEEDRDAGKHDGSVETQVDTEKVLLEVNDVTVGYDELEVVFDVSLKIHPGEVVVLAGRNGAGKTTLFRTIAGFLTPKKGMVVLSGDTITGMEAYDIAQKGLKYIHQDKKVFGTLSVRENLNLSGYAMKNFDLSEVLRYFPKLEVLMDRKAENLSGGEKQMLLMAMAMIGEPEIILMDEPTEGLAPSIINDLGEIFSKLRNKTTLFIVEQNLPLVAKIADRVYSMKEGKVVAETTDKEKIENLEFERYL